MNDTNWNELEVAPRSAVMEAARQFAKVLGDTPMFQAYEQSYYKLRQDQDAQDALMKYQEKLAPLKSLLRINAVNVEDQNELQRLKDQFYIQPAVVQYTKAQEELIAVCQEIGDQLSASIGLDFGASCRQGGCCG